MMIDHYPFTRLDGPRQMAIDDAMLDRAADGVASLRFYDWNTPTVSLGYFQPAAVRSLVPGIPWLRRATGGELILHGDGDITYSLALPGDKRWHDGEPWLCRMHHLLQKAFKTFGVNAKTIVCGEETRLGPGHCFLHHTAGDLTLDGVKIAGSAQRRHRGALIQHGTIRLKASTLAPQFRGALENVPCEDYLSEVIRQFKSVTGWTMHDTAFGSQIEEAAERYYAQRYGNEEWNNKR